MKIRKFFSPDAEDAASYGYADDETKQSPFNFGLNAGVARLTKFEYIPNGGAGGAEQDALDIVFNINGTDKSYRLFPVTKVYKDNVELTDTTTAEYKEEHKKAMTNTNAVVTHILHSFLSLDAIKAGFSRPIKSFKEYAQTAANMLPKDFQNKPLDIFLQFQWQISSSQNRTYLDIPKKMSYGRWLCPAQEGTWKENRAENITESTREALWYTNEKGEKHPFTKNGWFMLSNFAKQQRLEGADDETNTEAASNMNAGTSEASTPSTGNAAASAW